MTRHALVPGDCHDASRNADLMYKTGGTAARKCSRTSKFLRPTSRSTSTTSAVVEMYTGTPWCSTFTNTAPSVSVIKLQAALPSDSTTGTSACASASH